MIGSCTQHDHFTSSQYIPISFEMITHMSKPIKPIRHTLYVHVNDYQVITIIYYTRTQNCSSMGTKYHILCNSRDSTLPTGVSLDIFRVF